MDAPVFCEPENRYHLDFQFLNNPMKTRNFMLYQIGKMLCTPNTVIEKHAQEAYFELTIIKEGRGTVWTNGMRVPVKNGDIYLSFPGDWHQIDSDNTAPLVFVFYTFSTIHPPFAEALEDLMLTHAAAEERLFQNDRIGALVEDALAELGDKTPSLDLLDAIFYQITAYLLRSFSNVPEKNTDTHISDADAMCFRMMHYIDTHLFSMRELSEIADAHHYNYSYLSKLFHKTTSGTLSDYYRTRRLETARLLLKENKETVTQISDMLHYSSPQAFSRSFCEKYGIPPKSYQLSQK